MTTLLELKKEWLQDEAIKEEFEKDEKEFCFARTLIQARTQAGMTQTDVAKAMGTTQSVIARLEGGRMPSVKTLLKFANVTNTKLSIDLIPQGR